MAVVKSLTDSIVAPINEKAPQGGALIDDPDFELLDAELIKRGGLSHGEIDWAAVEEASRKILTSKSKHLTALSGLCAALARKNDAKSLEDAMTLADAFLARYWAIAHPAGPSKARRRLVIATEIWESLCKAALGHEHNSQAARTALIAALKRLEARMAELGVDPPAEAAQARQKLGRTDGDKPTPPIRSAVEPQTYASGPAENHAAGAAIDQLVAMGVREIKDYKKDIKQFADRIGAISPGAPISFRMRRYAAWLRQDRAPLADDTGKTGIQPMPTMVTNEFVAALANPNPGALNRLEDRLFSDPDWFDGHRLAAQLAEGCGYAEAAATIREVIADRLRRFTDLLRLRMTDDSALISDAVGSWAGDGDQTGVAGGANAPWGEALTAARELRASGGDAGAALGLLDAGLETARGDRDRAYWRLAMADLLDDMDLAKLAAETRAAVAHDIERRGLASWEPDLIAYARRGLKDSAT